MLCPRYLQHTPLSFKLKWFPDLGFCIANLKVAEVIVLFIALSMLACYKVPTLMICSSQLMVQSSEYLAVNTPPVLGYFDTKSWNPFLRFSCCSNGNPYLQLPDLPGKMEKTLYPGENYRRNQHSKELHPEAVSFSQNSQDKVVICLSWAL